MIDQCLLQVMFEWFESLINANNGASINVLQIDYHKASRLFVDLVCARGSWQFSCLDQPTIFQFQLRADTEAQPQPQHHARAHPQICRHTERRRILHLRIRGRYHKNIKAFYKNIYLYCCGLSVSSSDHITNDPVMSRCQSICSLILYQLFTILIG